MWITRNLIIVCALSFIAFGFFCPTRTSAQTKPAVVPSEQDQTLQKLLNEVHELRLAIQRATANSARVQMLIERTRLQQARVEVLTRQLENIQSQAADIKGAKPDLSKRSKMLRSN